jgi:hypothetical protein
VLTPAGGEGGGTPPAPEPEGDDEAGGGEEDDGGEGARPEQADRGRHAGGTVRERLVQRLRERGRRP